MPETQITDPKDRAAWHFVCGSFLFVLFVFLFVLRFFFFLNHYGQMLRVAEV